MRFAWIDSLFAAPVTVSLADLCQGAHWLLGGGLEGVLEFLSEFLWSWERVWKSLEGGCDSGEPSPWSGLSK